LHCGIPLGASISKGSLRSRAFEPQQYLQIPPQQAHPTLKTINNIRHETFCRNFRDKNCSSHSSKLAREWTTNNRLLPQAPWSAAE
jgi:hypothetical protein